MFDKILTYIPHIKQQKMPKNNNYSKPPITPIIRWRKTTLSSPLYRFGGVYGSVVYDCRSVVCGLATKTALQLLNPGLHLCLRFCCGAFCTSTVRKFYAEVDIWSLAHQRTYLDLLCANKISSINTHSFNLFLIIHS